ncbi:Lrp/AsnC family transcriptional regulator [Microbacterium sp. cx-59]|uniref:Lrp/AsnC family transcriptional regulator n=1 Tax=Microbacterium sp. cx-59 TaxID=2891207 RepID=UPI001E39EEDE|nr:Lrp/AsnC family transcriptional regulator [Microbacterium sp. cx-59]MCC4908890.1 Lrp/AsnC family transcriptional regulator [Microbacterium sp. cx-59]
MRETDLIDQRILAEMRTNARISHARLGEIVRLSRTAVRQRIGRLERDGLIRGYTLVESFSDPATRVRATLLVYRYDRMRGSDVVLALSSIPEVVRCDVVTGEYDLIVQVEAKDSERIRDVWQHVANLTGVRDITTVITLSTVIERSR